MGILRFVLAVVVVLFHLDLESAQWDRFADFSFTNFSNLNASEAVNIFFLISGFVIALTFNKNYENYNFIKRSSNFYLNRILRIYPLYFFSLLIAFIDSYFLNIINLPKDNPFVRYDILRNIILIFHEKGSFINSVSWSLDFELRWYLLIPVIFFLKNIYNKNNFNRILVIIFVFIYLLFELFYLDYAKNDLSEGGFRYSFILGESLFYFIPGYLTYEIFSRIKINFNEKYYYLGLIFLLLAFIFPKTPLVIFYLVSIYFCFLINYSNNLDKLLGDLSYPIYILHLPVMLPIYLQVNKYIGYLNLSDISYYYVVYILTLLIFCVFCYLSLIFIQYPIDKLRKNFKSNKN